MNKKTKEYLKRKSAYSFGEELIECDCGHWTLRDLPCWNCGGRSQTFIEAQAELAQSIRNLGYEILKAMRLVK